MEIVTVCGLCITASVLCKVVEKNNKEISTVISVIAAVIVLMTVISKISRINDVVSELFLQSGISGDYGAILMKSAGICYITQIGSDCCKDCGENNLATVTELAGKISVMYLSLPVIENIISIVQGLLT